jgi:hypothetical protein
MDKVQKPSNSECYTPLSEFFTFCIFFGQKFDGEKESVGQCVVMLQQPVILSPKFRAKHILMQSPWNVTVVCGIDCLACQDKFFVNNPLDVKENYEHAPDFTFRLSRSRWIWISHVCVMLSSPNACLINARVSVAYFSRFAQNLMLFLCWILWEITSGQIHIFK